MIERIIAQTPLFLPLLKTAPLTSFRIVLVEKLEGEGSGKDGKVTQYKTCQQHFNHDGITTPIFMGETCYFHLQHPDSEEDAFLNGYISYVARSREAYENYLPASAELQQKAITWDKEEQHRHFIAKWTKAESISI